MTNLSGDDNKLINNHPDLVAQVVEIARHQAGKLHIVIMSNSSFGGIHQEIIQRLHS